MGRPIVEREGELAQLAAAAREAMGGDGSIVLILGEAGIGKSSVVESIRSVLPAEGRLLVGYCDDLATPRVLGPLRDLIGSVGHPLTRALAAGDRSQVIDALRAELDWPGHPTVLVVEDVHWADEATLDVLRFLVRRISTMPVVLVLTYRDDELTRDHPLRHLLGIAAGTPRLRRLRLARLSERAVHRLGAGSGLDTAQVYAVTSGNPFFVAEILASGDVGGVPPTIAEAVRARLSDLDGPTRDALEQLAVVPSTVERWLVEAVVPGGLAGLATAEQRGVLAVSPTRVAFRHELARRAVVDSMPAARRVACNQAVLAALLARWDAAERDEVSANEVGPNAVGPNAVGPNAVSAKAVDPNAVDPNAVDPNAVGPNAVGPNAVGPHETGPKETGPHEAGRDGVDLSRTLHHAVEVGDERVIVRYGPAAALEAAGAGSHREAVAYYRLVLRHRTAFSPGDRADLLAAYAIECYTIGLADLAVAAQQDSVQLRRGLGDPQALGVGLRWLSRIYWWAGRRPDAEACAVEAIDMLTEAGDRPALALALSNQSQLHALAGHGAASVAVGQRAVAMARDLGAAGTLSHALNNMGVSYLRDGLPQGRAMLDESLAVALGAGEVEHACRAYVNIAWNLIEDVRLDEAGRILEAGIELAEQAEFLGFLRYMHVEQSLVSFARGRWDEAEREAEWAADAQLTMRCPALVLLGRTRIRRGRPGGAELLGQAWEIAQQLGEPQRIGPAVAGLAEAAWLRGDLAALRSVLAPLAARIHEAGIHEAGIHEGRIHEAGIHEGRIHEGGIHEGSIHEFGSGTCAAELAYWMSVAGLPAPMAGSRHPFALQAHGRWQEAAALWQRAGCRYQYATALAQSTDPPDVFQSLAILEELGTEPLARRVRLRLRELGVTRVPRGPAPSTRDNPARLTGRQVEVVRLLAAGLTNAEIAGRLVLSVRTVDSHVAAILDKLDARTRRDATTRAKELGLVT